MKIFAGAARLLNRQLDVAGGGFAEEKIVRVIRPGPLEVAVPVIEEIVLRLGLPGEVNAIAVNPVPPRRCDLSRHNRPRPHGKTDERPIGVECIAAAVPIALLPVPTPGIARSRGIVCPIAENGCSDVKRNGVRDAVFGGWRRAVPIGGTGLKIAAGRFCAGCRPSRPQGENKKDVDAGPVI